MGECSSVLAREAARDSHVERQQPEPSAARAAQGPEMALVGTEEIQRSVAVREDDDRRVGQSDAQVGIALHDAAGVSEILGRKQFELVRAARDFSGILGAGAAVSAARRATASRSSSASLHPRSRANRVNARFSLGGR